MTKKIAVYIAVMTIILSACTKMDDYKNSFIPSGSEITYTGRIDSLKIVSGKNRVEVSGLFTSDPRITSCRIYWDLRADSVEVPVTRTKGIDTLRKIITGLTEGAHSFEVITYDAQGNHSVPVPATSYVYGARFESGLLNRFVVSNDYFEEGDSVVVAWDAYDPSSGLLANFITYTNLNGSVSTLYAPVADYATTLYNYKKGGYFTYQSLYQPGTNNIDTFYSPVVDTVRL